MDPMQLRCPLCGLTVREYAQAAIGAVVGIRMPAVCPVLNHVSNLLG